MRTVDKNGRAAAANASAPARLLLALELPRATTEFWALLAAAPWLGRAPKRGGEPVIVLPGFMASDASTLTLRTYLGGLGYEVQGWQLGRNLGPTTRCMSGMHDLLVETASLHEQPVSVIGWSLGGVYARELAHREPELVRQVITLGSPFAMSDTRQSTVSRLYERQSHLHDAQYQTPPALQQVSQPLAVPSAAIYTRTDGVVAWQTCIETSGPCRENVEVLGSHAGLGLNPAVLWAVADRLGLPQGEWRPFAPPRWLRPLFPPPAYADDLDHDDESSEALAA
jgi:pimeloyl-ACP methyl ester carboxylesterase